MDKKCLEPFEEEDEVFDPEDDELLELDDFDDDDDHYIDEDDDYYDDTYYDDDDYDYPALPLWEDE